jgi:hypothetical protein
MTIQEVQRGYVDSKCIKVPHTWDGDESTTAAERSVLYLCFSLFLGHTQCNNMISGLCARLLYFMIIAI